MTTRTVGLIGILSLCAVATAPAAFGADRQNYLMLRLGIFTPTGDLDDTGYDGGMTVDYVFGHYLESQRIIEAEIGDFTADDGYWRGKVDTTPLRVTLKQLYPGDGLTPYVEAGLGVYFVDRDTALRDKDDLLFGLHIGGGLNHAINETVFVGAGVRYTKTEANYVNNLAFTANIGYRF